MRSAAFSMFAVSDVNLGGPSLGLARISSLLFRSLLRSSLHAAWQAPGKDCEGPPPRIGAPMGASLGRETCPGLLAQGGPSVNATQS